jgi:hypothetical protein
MPMSRSMHDNEPAPRGARSEGRDGTCRSLWCEMGTELCWVCTRPDYGSFKRFVRRCTSER